MTDDLTTRAEGLLAEWDVASKRENFGFDNYVAFIESKLNEAYQLGIEEQAQQIATLESKLVDLQDTLREQVQRLSAALQTYGQHTGTCAVNLDIAWHRYEAGACTCGFDAALTGETE